MVDIRDATQKEKENLRRVLGIEKLRLELKEEGWGGVIIRSWTLRCDCGRSKSFVSDAKNGQDQRTEILDAAGQFGWLVKKGKIEILCPNCARLLGEVDENLLRKPLPGVEITSPAITTTAEEPANVGAFIQQSLRSSQGNSKRPIQITSREESSGTKQISGLHSEGSPKLPVQPNRSPGNNRTSRRTRR